MHGKRFFRTGEYLSRDSFPLASQDTVPTILENLYLPNLPKILALGNAVAHSSPGRSPAAFSNVAPRPRQRIIHRDFKAAANKNSTHVPDGAMILELELIGWERRWIMATYVLLLTFTDQGVHNAKDTTKRAEAFKSVANKAGGKVKEVYWTLGQYDGVLIIEAPDEATATALALSLSSLGYVQTQTLRAFSAEEVSKILAKMA